MNKKLGLAVAGALVAFASTANAGISIPAGDWTVDISGNVNAFYIHNTSDDSNTIDGGLANKKGANGSSSSSINTGLLPSWLTIGAKTRQNDLDVAWAISFQPGASQGASLGGGGGSEFRQAYLTFGDASWGTIKVGKDLGVFGSDAILSDMTLLGVGSQGVVGTAGGTTTTLGRIGAGYMYADFNGQINYTTPNFNGFQATVGIDQPIVGTNITGAQKSPAYVGLVRYSFTADEVTGKVWAEAKGQSVDSVSGVNDTSTMYGVGANLSAAGFTATGYYYSGEGAGTTAFLVQGYSATGKSRDSDGGYVQATYALPTIGTKVGVSWGISNLDLAAGEVNATLVSKNEMVTVGAYHPLTKSVNLVAEYSNVKSKNQAGAENQSDIVSAGAILFF